MNVNFAKMMLWVLTPVAWLVPMATLAQTNAINRSGMWWKADEPGWGLTLQHQGNAIFPAWFTYNANGKVHWWVSSVATLQADGSFSGEVYEFDGTPLLQINGAQASRNPRVVGTMRLQFPSTDALNFSYTINGVSQSKVLQPFVFAATTPTCTFTSGSRASANNYTDMWWNRSESGWGVHLLHQGTQIFAAWYSYGVDEKAVWLTALLNRQSDGVFRGEINRPAQGIAFSQINAAPATTFPLPAVGQLSLQFIDGERATMQYTVDGGSQSKSIERFVFASPVGICSDAAVLAEPAACLRDHHLGDVSEYQFTLPDGGLQTNRFIAQTTTAIGSDSVMVIEQRDGNDVTVQKQYVAQNVDRHLIHRIDVINPNSGLLITRTDFSPAIVMAKNPPLQQTQTQIVRASISGSSLPASIAMDVTVEITRKPAVAIALVNGNQIGCTIEAKMRSNAEGGVIQSNVLSISNGAVGEIKSVASGSNAAGATATTTQTLIRLTPTPAN